MHIIMYIMFLITIAVTIYGGCKAGIFETSFDFFRNLMAFWVAFTLFAPLTDLAIAMVSRLEIYPGPEYLRAVLFGAIFIIFIGVCDQLRFKFLFSGLEITTGKYPDLIGGGSLGLLNGIVITGFVLILWAMFPFAKYMPGDSGRVETDRLPVDTGALLLKSYAHTSSRMGGSDFYLSTRERTAEDDDEVAMEKGWLNFYNSHADFSIHEIDRIMDDVEVIVEEVE